MKAVCCKSGGLLAEVDEGIIIFLTRKKGIYFLYKILDLSVAP